MKKIWLDEWIGQELQSLPIVVHIVLAPVNTDRDQTLKILAPIKA